MCFRCWSSWYLALPKQTYDLNFNHKKGVFPSWPNFVRGGDINQNFIWNKRVCTVISMKTWYSNTTSSLGLVMIFKQHHGHWFLQIYWGSQDCKALMKTFGILIGIVRNRYNSSATIIILKGTMQPITASSSWYKEERSWYSFVAYGLKLVWKRKDILRVI